MGCCGPRTEDPHAAHQCLILGVGKQATLFMLTYAIPILGRHKGCVDAVRGQALQRGIRADGKGRVAERRVREARQRRAADRAGD